MKKQNVEGARNNEININVNANVNVNLKDSEQIKKELLEEELMRKREYRRKYDERYYTFHIHWDREEDKEIIALFEKITNNKKREFARMCMKYCFFNAKENPNNFYNPFIGFKIL